MTSKLSSDETKRTIVTLSEHLGTVEISRKLGIPSSTVSDFLTRRTHAEWWSEYSKSLDSTPQAAHKFNIAVADVEPIRISTSDTVKELPTHLMIPDTQTKPGIDLSYCSWIGEYIADKKPDVIVHIGDHFDMPSLSSYDKGTKKAEGRRLKEDITAGIEAMNLILAPIKSLQDKEYALYGEVLYKPKMVFCLGNHENRVERHINANPELAGFTSYADFRLKENGWEVYDFLEPAKVNGIHYIHFVPNPMTGKPYGGSAANILQKTGESFSMGHKQTLDTTNRTLPLSGRKQWGMVCGAAYPHDEDYKGYTGNSHWRGIVVKHRVKDGDYDPMYIDLQYLKERFERKQLELGE